MPHQDVRHPLLDLANEADDLGGADPQVALHGVPFDGAHLDEPVQGLADHGEDGRGLGTVDRDALGGTARHDHAGQREQILDAVRGVEA